MNLLERVNQLLPDDCVALYGTSHEQLAQIRSNQFLSPYPSENMLPYQRKLVADGKHLYYAFPVIKQGALHNLDITSNRDILRWVCSYAQRHATVDCFKDIAGIITNSEIVIARALSFRKQFDQLCQHEATFSDGVNPRRGHEEYSGRDDIQGEMWCLREQVGRYRFDTAVKRSVVRKGVILCFSPELLKEDILPGHEDSNEIMILSDQPLSTSVINTAIDLETVSRITL